MKTKATPGERARVSERMRLRPIDALKEQARDRWQCATCPSPLDEVEDGGDGRHCRSCRSYWDDVRNGLFDKFDDWDWQPAPARDNDTRTE